MFDRFEELYDLVENNPDALIEDCTSTYDEWSDLASFVPSGQALSRITNSNGTWDIQFLDDASGTRINLDRFGVRVKELPFKNGSNGLRMSPKEMFDYFRKNISDFAPKFKPYSNPYDTNLWASDNPLGAVMEIEMFSPGGFDLVDGDVLTSQYDDCCWIFTTLTGSPVFYGSGFHPVSGNRQFGFNYQNGVFEIYTKGADRATKWFHGLQEGELAYGKGKGKEFWNLMQKNLQEYILQKGGQMDVNPKTEEVHNPKWDAVRSLLLQTTPITHVPCH